MGLGCPWSDFWLVLDEAAFRSPWTGATDAAGAADGAPGAPDAAGYWAPVWGRPPVALAAGEAAALGRAAGAAASDPVEEAPLPVALWGAAPALPNDRNPDTENSSRLGGRVPAIPAARISELVGPALVARPAHGPGPEGVPALYDNRPGGSFDLDRADPQPVDQGAIMV